MPIHEPGAPRDAVPATGSESTDDRSVRRPGWLTDDVTGLQRAGGLDPAVPADTIVRVLGVFTLGLVHAPGMLGACRTDELDLLKEPG